MLPTLNKILPPLLGCLVLLSLADKSVAEGRDTPSEKATISESAQTKGYRDIVFFREKLIAVGSDGRIAGISTDGNVVTVDNSTPVRLNCAFANDDFLLAAGEDGTILYSTDGKRFERVESGTDKIIYSITGKNGLLLAGSEDGFLLGSKDGQSWKTLPTGAKGNILSLSANDAFFIGVTDAGEILKSSDGFDWDIQDYNQEYAGFYPRSNFARIVATENSIVIIGSHDDGSPSILFSSIGNVWAERVPFYYDDDDKLCYLTENPNDVIFDPIQDQFILACDNGVLFSFPACAKCNEYTKISDRDLCALFIADNALYMAGDDFSVFVQRL